MRFSKIKFGIIVKACKWRWPIKFKNNIMKVFFLLSGNKLFGSIKYSLGSNLQSSHVFNLVVVSLT